MQPAARLVDRADREQIGHVDVAAERLRLIDQRAHEVQALHVDRRTGREIAVDVDRARHAADQVVRVRVLAAEDRVDLDPLLLQVERLEVMRDGHQVRFRRQQIGRIAPVAVHERAELAAFDELAQPRLDVAEIARRRHRMRRRHALLEFGGELRVGLQRGHDVDPVERVQVIEVHRVVMHLQRLRHDLADQVRVRRNPDVERVLDRANRRQRVAAGADAADALDERPRIARVAALENHFESAPHGAGGHRVADHVVRVDVHFDPHVAFDARHGIDDDPASAVVELKTLGGIGCHAVV